MIKLPAKTAKIMSLKNLYTTYTVFVNPMQLYKSCEKFRGLHLREPGLMADSYVDEIQVRFNFLKLAVDQNIRFSALFS